MKERAHVEKGKDDTLEAYLPKVIADVTSANEAMKLAMIPVQISKPHFGVGVSVALCPD